MAGKGSALTRAIKYFEEADIREAKVAFELVKQTMASRLKDRSIVLPPKPKKVKKNKGPQAAAGAGTTAAATENQESLASA